MPAELISAAFTLLAFEDSLSFQLQQYDFKKLSGDFLCGGQVRNQDRAVSIFPGKDCHGLEPILGLHGKHNADILPIK
jgi:hypothetical protein